MRKYDMKNKRNIGIIIGISILIIIMFSLFTKLFLNRDRNEYKVLPETLVFDIDRNIVKANDNAIIKTKWNKEYYLIQPGSSSKLGKSSITYNNDSGEIKLYGRYYEIGSGDEINITAGETTIKNSILTKFYKLEDRKYLVIDKEIRTADGLLSTSDFLLIDLDKVGNATFTNHKVNLKSFSKTTIVTSNYTFDIANEILSFGSQKIDLKKIIGSTNTYTKEELEPEESPQEATENATIDIQNTATENGGEGNSNENTEETKTKEPLVVEEIKKASKQTSVISVNTTVSKIMIDYVIYDPHNEYSSVYMEVQREGSNNIDTIYLNSSATSYELTKGILPNTTYKLTFKYNYLDENNEMIVRTFDDISVTTKKPKVSLKVTKTSFNNITYLITTDNSVNISSGLLTIYVNGKEYSSNNIDIEGNKVGTFYIENVESNDLVELKLTNVISNGNVIKDVTANYKFRY